MARVVVVGAGLGGLSCAFALRAAGVAVVVCEARERAGGVVGTIQRGDFRFETGPHSVLPSSATFRRLCGALGLAERLVPSSERARSRYLWLGGRLQRLPQGPLELVTTPVLSARAKLRLLREPLRRRRPDPAGAPEPSLAAFLTERIGAEPAQRLAGAFVRGIYAGDVNRLGARSAFPRLWRMVEEHGSLLRGLLRSRAAAADAPPLPGPAFPRGRLLSLPGGLQEFVAALGRSLGDDLRTSTVVERLERAAGGWSVGLVGGARLRADAVVLAVPAPAARALLIASAPRTALELLGGIEHAQLSVCHLGFAEVGEEIVPEGFGYLVPPTERGPGVPRVLGTIYASNLFAGRAPEGGFSVASFYRTQDVDHADPETIVRLAESELARSLGWRVTPPISARAVFSWKDVIPQYTIGHAERMARLEQCLAAEAPGLHLAASYVGGVSVEDVLARGQAVAQRIAPTTDAGARTP